MDLAKEMPAPVTVASSSGVTLPAQPAPAASARTGTPPPKATAPALIISKESKGLEPIGTPPPESDAPAHVEVIPKRLATTVRSVTTAKPIEQVVAKSYVVYPGS